MRLAGFFPLLFFLFVSPNAESWSAKTYQLIVVKSVEVMPFSFRHIVLKHQEEILDGSLHPDQLGESKHTYDLQKKTGTIQQRVDELVKTIPKNIYNHAPFSDVCRDLGRLSHYMSDLNDPLLLSDRDTRESTYHDDFAIYAENNIPLFPWIFSGHENSALKKDQVDAYIYQIASNTAQYYSQIGDAYYPEGQLVSSATFDPKSLPFGIASLGYSHSIESTVQIWFYVWRKSHGDITYTPFYNEKHKP
jgi:hypothetical protein